MMILGRLLSFFLIGIVLADDEASVSNLRASNSVRKLAALPSPSHRFTFNGLASDTVGGVTGVLKGLASFSPVAAEGRESLYLPCCNSSLLLDNTQLKNAFTEYTVSLWFRPDGRGGYRYLYEEGSATIGFAIRLNGLTLEAAMIEGGGGASSERVASAGEVELKKWQHAALVYADSKLSIIFNGEIKDTIDTGYGEFEAHSNPASIGSPGLNNANSNNFYVGMIDDLRIWDGRALTKDQITQLYQETAKSPNLAVTHQWSFNGQATDSINNVVGVLRDSASYAPGGIEGGQSLKLPCCNSSVLLDNGQLKNAFTFYTISLWFRADKIGGYRYLYEQGASGTGFAIRLNGTKLEAAVIEDGGGPNNVKSVSVGTVKKGQWHHAVAVYNNGKLSIVLDGVWRKRGTIETNFGELSAHSDAASIGSPGLLDYDSGVYFVGTIDDLRIWDGTALSKDQISQLYSLFVPDLRPNFVLFVADDLNFDSPGFMGGVAPDVTPNLDKLASESLVFKRSYAAASVCQPSRQAMLSGKYPANFGSTDFFPMASGTPTAVTSLKNSGYLTASFYKNHHMRPSSSFPWAMTDDSTFLNGREFRTNGVAKEIGRSPSMLAEATLQTIASSKSINKPFFLVINSADPHRPFHGTQDEDDIRPSYQIEPSSRVYNTSEVTIPSPLRDIPGVRSDVANYATSVRRLDDTVGRCLDAIKEAGIADNTIVMFVSDNGMPMPFGKFETYRDSYLGPLIVHWPGRIAPSVDTTHLVSLTDIAPTLVDIAGSEPIPNIDGRSLLPLINKQPNVVWRDVAVGTRYEDIFYGNHILLFPDPEAFRTQLKAQGWVDAPEHPTPGTMKRTMNKRGITDGTYHYMFNHFFPFFNANNVSAIYEYQMDPSYLSLMRATVNDTDIWARMDFYNHRAHEELYNIRIDPGSERNLVGTPEYGSQLSTLKQKLLDWMVETNDPIRPDFENFLKKGN